MSPARRRMMDREHPSLSIVRQCALLGVNCSSIYYRPRAASEGDLSLKAYASVPEAQNGLEACFRFYNGFRPHQALGYRTPAEVFHGEQGVVEGNYIMRGGVHREREPDHWQESRDSHLAQP